MYKVDLEKAKKIKIKLPTSLGSQKKQDNSKITSTFASLTMLTLTVCITKNWKILRDGNTRPPYLSPEKLVCRIRSNT